MAYGLPSRGQRDWDDELNNSMEALHADTQSATANASNAVSTANTALNIAQSVQNAVLTPITVPGGAEGLVAKDDMLATDLVVAVAGDSTGDEIAESFWRGVGRWVADRPDIAAAGYYGYGESGPYTGPTDIQTSAGGYWATYYRDEFERSGELVGSTPDVGLPYGGSAGMWTMAAGSATVASASGSAAQDADYTSPGGRRKVTADITFNTATGAGTDKVLSLFIGATTSNRVQLRLSMTSAGTQAWILNKIIGGVSTLLATGSGSPLAAASNNSVTISLEMNPDGTITGKVGASTVTGSLPGAEADAVVDLGARVWFQTSNAASVGAITLSRIEAVKFVNSTRNLTLYNGSRAGSTAQYAIDRLSALFPVAPDVLFVNYGHNYGSGGTAAFITAIDALCSAFRTLHPSSGIVLCSQNPEFSPAANASAHRNRQAVLRRYAATKGYGYLPLFEFYAAQTDQGASWVQSDGVHPKTHTDAADPANGAHQGATLLRNYLNSLSNRLDITTV